MESFKELLEGAITKAAAAVLAISFANSIRKPFSDWDAFKLGLIDEKGELKKKASTKEEKAAMDPLTNIVRKIKKILIKYVGDSKILGFLIAAYLLKKESYSALNIDEEINEVLDESEQAMLIDTLMLFIENDNIKF